MFTRGTKGQAIVIALVIISALLIAAEIFTKIALSEEKITGLYVQKEKAFYLAEAGLEDGKSVLAANPNWFTDSPHVPPDDVSWIIEGAKGSVKHFGGGSYKIVRESGKNVIYSAGYTGSGRSIVRVKYHIDPFRAYEFKIL